MENTCGYVYVMINPSYGEDVVKIGKTTKEPEERAKELSAATGVATPFIVVYKRLFKNCHWAEKLVHQILEEKGCRVNTNREFFSISISEAINVILQIPDTYNNDDNVVIDDTNDEVVTDLASEYLAEALDYCTGSEDKFQDYNKAIACLEKSATLGNAESCALLGNIWNNIKGCPEKALNAFQNAINLGNWGSYAEIAKIYGNKKNRCYNPINEDLAWKKYFENLQVHNNDLSLDDWDDKSIGENFFTRLFQLLIENKEIPKLMDDLAYAHMEYLQDALETQISSMKKDCNTFMLAGQYKLHIGKYLIGIEEKVLLSDVTGDTLGKNYYIVAEKYMDGDDGYEKNEEKALRYFEESNRLGHKRALIAIGNYWLRHDDGKKNKFSIFKSHKKQLYNKTNDAWKKYYNYIYDKFYSKAVIASGEEKDLIAEDFYCMFFNAISKDAKFLLHDYYFYAALDFGLMDYLNRVIDECSQLHEEIENFQPRESDEFSDAIEDTLTSLKKIQLSLQLSMVQPVFYAVKDFVENHKDEENPMINRLE